MLYSAFLQLIKKSATLKQPQRLLQYYYYAQKPPWSPPLIAHTGLPCSILKEAIVGVEHLMREKEKPLPRRERGGERDERDEGKERMK